MKIPSHKIILSIKMLILLLASLIWAGCTGEDEHSQSTHHSLLERLEHESAPSPNTNLTIETNMENTQRIPVKDAADVPQFYVLERSSEITKYPCTTCHNQPLARMKAGPKAENPRAHWDIVIQHANADVMNCLTCHNEGKIDQLQLLTGREVSFEHSYQVCAQCHSRQFQDWTGGAHGKRIAGWAPPRVVNNCVDCHNPHQPAWEIRWPAHVSKPVK